MALVLASVLVTSIKVASECQCCYDYHDHHHQNDSNDESPEVPPGPRPAHLLSKPRLGDSSRLGVSEGWGLGVFVAYV